MLGPMGWPGRREAPIRCGYARTYEAGKWGMGFGHTPFGPGRESISQTRAYGNRTDV
jgi:hypothetical protein